VNKLIRDEKGQAMILALMMLLVGSLITAPLMGFMGTGLIAGQVLEERMEELYAADAGAEDALYKLVNNDASLPGTVGDTWTPPSIVMNGKGVGIEIVLAEDALGFIKELEGANSASNAHPDWTVLGEALVDGTYRLEITYTGAATTARLQGVGAWFQGSQWNKVGPARGITEDFPQFTFEQTYYKGGIAFMWSWGPAANKMPLFDKNDPPSLTAYLEFDFLPPATPSLFIGWSYANNEDVGIVAAGSGFEIWKVTSTATDSTTGKQTTVVTYVFRQGGEEPYTVDIITWETSLQ
jgi:hypothetical protein